ncbi:MAG: PTS sugar transporter subunit IIB [Brevefilum sp.]
MADGKITVLAVCASGVSVSSLLARKIIDSLDPLDLEVRVIHLLPTIVEGFIAENPVDFIVTTSPIPGEIDVPVINGIPLLSGFGEEAVREDIRQTANKVLGRE